MGITHQRHRLFWYQDYRPLCLRQVFHWLVQDRVDYIETTPSVSRLQHLRIVTFMVLLLVRPSAVLAAVKLHVPKPRVKHLCGTQCAVNQTLSGARSPVPL